MSWSIGPTSPRSRLWAAAHGRMENFPSWISVDVSVLPCAADEIAVSLTCFSKRAVRQRTLIFHADTWYGFDEKQECGMVPVWRLITLNICSNPSLNIKMERRALSVTVSWLLGLHLSTEVSLLWVGGCASPNPPLLRCIANKISKKGRKNK